MRIVLHIGLPKTGSTTIQNCLDASAEPLAKAGTKILTGLGHGSNSFLLSCYGLTFSAKLLQSNYHLRRHRIRNRPQFEAMRSRLKEQFLDGAAGTGHGTLVVSSEAFSQGLRQADEVARFVELMREVASDIRVIVYLRRQDEVVVSAYSQALRGGSTERLKLKVPQLYLNYGPLLDRWSEAVGRKNLSIGLLEKVSLHNGDLLDDFFHRAGLPLDSIVRTPAANFSLSADALEYLRLMNEHVPVFDAESGGLNVLRGHLVSLLNQWSRDRPRLTLAAEQRAFVLQIARPHNEEVARAFFNRTDGRLFASVEPQNTNGSVRGDKVPSPETKLTTEESMAISAYLWTRLQSVMQSYQRQLKGKGGAKGRGALAPPDKPN